LNKLVKKFTTNEQKSLYNSQNNNFESESDLNLRESRRNFQLIKESHFDNGLNEKIRDLNEKCVDYLTKLEQIYFGFKVINIKLR
jgi:hypothetical protein